MTTLCASDHPDYELAERRRAAIKEAVSRHCGRLRLNGAQTFECVSHAFQSFSEGVSASTAIRNGKRWAAKLANARPQG